MERERQRCEGKQADLEVQNASNVALRKELLDEQNRVNSCELDIRRLESSLASLKDSMGAEYAAKSRDYDHFKSANEELSRAHNRAD